MARAKADEFLFLGYEIGIKIKIWQDGRIEIIEPINNWSDLL
jgi:hypothetical protein